MPNNKNFMTSLILKRVGTLRLSHIQCMKD